MSARPSRRTGARGQALAEFALVFPVFFLVVAGMIQFGIIFWGQNTLTQVVRDTGRWAASQKNCGDAFKGDVRSTARLIAGQSSLFGYRKGVGANTGSWSDGSIVVTYDPASGCVPASNTQTAWVTIAVTHQVPVFFPWIPGDGRLRSEATFRMEPCAGAGCPRP